MRPEDVLLPTPAGVYCKIGAFHIDPTRPVDKAVITHGHSDHARAGHGAVLATQETLDLMRLRYGETFAVSTQAVRYGEATYSSPKPRSDCRSFVTATPTPRSQSSCVQSNCFPTAHISSEPIRSARYSA